jgi:hypothetical protein
VALQARWGSSCAAGAGLQDYTVPAMTALYNQQLSRKQEQLRPYIVKGACCSAARINAALWPPLAAAAGAACVVSKMLAFMLLLHLVHLL